MLQWGGGGSGSDFIYSNHISESLYLNSDCNRILICSHISGCAKYARWHTLYMLPYEKYTLTQHLTLTHYNHLCSPWFLIQLYTRFSALYGQCLAISNELLHSCMVRNCLMYTSLRFTMCYFYPSYSPISIPFQDFYPKSSHYRISICI